MDKEEVDPTAGVAIVVPCSIVDAFMDIDALSRRHDPGHMLPPAHCDVDDDDDDADDRAARHVVYFLLSMRWLPSGTIPACQAQSREGPPLKPIAPPLPVLPRLVARLGGGRGVSRPTADADDAAADVVVDEDSELVEGLSRDVLGLTMALAFPLLVEAVTDEAPVFVMPVESRVTLVPVIPASIESLSPFAERS